MTSPNGYNAEEEAPRDNARDMIQEEVAKALSDKIMPALKATGEKLQATILETLDPEKIALAAATMVRDGMRQDTQTRMDEARAQMEAISEEPAQATVTATPAPASGLREQIRSDPINTIGGMLQQALDIWGKVSEMQFQRQVQTSELALRVAQAQDPVATIEKFVLERPLLAQLMAARIAPDPLEAQVPGMLSHTAQKAWDAAIKVGIQMGKREVAGIPESPLPPDLKPIAGLPEKPVPPAAATGDPHTVPQSLFRAIADGM